MSKVPLTGILGRIRRLAGESAEAGESDGALLRRFQQQRDEAAFAELVQRHGPMVLNTARALLGHASDADDVFQATFLVMARKAGSLTDCRSVAGWLCGVTRRVALQARVNAARRQRHESQFMSTRSEGMSHEPATSVDLKPVLHEELARLSDKYREPMVLCYLQGMTNEEAAQKLGWPVGTLKVRMARARDLLRVRLARRGLALSVGALVAACNQASAAAVVVPPILFEATMQSALPFALGTATPELVRPAAAALAHGVQRSMMLQKLYTYAVLTIVACLVGGGAFVAGRPSSSSPKVAMAEPPANPAELTPPQPADKAPAQTAQPDEPVPAETAPAFPRRLLAISPSNYFYFSPVAQGVKDDTTDAHVQRIARTLHIPPAQVFHLSDALPGDRGRPPLKDVVWEAISDFAKTSRAQDRITLLFTGHAAEIEGVSYLIPLDGDAKDAESLISLKWLFEVLSNCEARQKIVILDVCRHDAQRGAERYEPGPMPPGFERMLKNPPEGIQVWTACSADEYSYESGNSFFLRSLAANLDEPAEAKPADSIGITTLSGKVNRAASREVERLLQQKQNPRRYGKEPKEGAEYDPKAKPAALVQFHGDNNGAFSQRTDLKLIQAIVEECRDVSLLKPGRDGVPALRADGFPVYGKAFLREYQAGNDSTPFRDAVVKANQVLCQVDRVLRMRFPTRNIDLLNRSVQDVRKKLALHMLELDEATEALQTAGKQRDLEKSKRW